MYLHDRSSPWPRKKIWTENASIAVGEVPKPNDFFYFQILHMNEEQLPDQFLCGIFRQVLKLTFQTLYCFLINEISSLQWSPTFRQEIGDISLCWLDLVYVENPVWVNSVLDSFLDLHFRCEINKEVILNLNYFD